MKQTKQAGAAALPKSGYFAMVCILIAGSLWGCLGLFNRHLSALGIAPETVVMLRNLGACLILGLIFLVYDRSIFRIRLRHLPIFLCSGLISILFFTLCYFRSQQVSSLAVAAILLYTAPTFVVILSALLWKDRITKRKLAALVLAFLGCCFVAGILNGALTLTPEGLLLGIGSGLFYSSYTIFGRFALKHYQPFTVTFYTFLIAGIGSLFMTSPGDLSTTFHSPMGDSPLPGTYGGGDGDSLPALHQGAQRPGRQRKGLHPGLRGTRGGLPGGHRLFRGTNDPGRRSGPGVHSGLRVHSEVIPWQK